MLYREKKKLRSYSFRKSGIDLWKNTKKHIYSAILYGEASLSKHENFVLFGDLCFKSKNSWHFEFSISQIFRQKFVVSENLTYLSQLLLKLRTVELAISFFPLMQKYIFLKASTKARVWWKLHVLWPTHHKMTVLSFFLRNWKETTF